MFQAFEQGFAVVIGVGADLPVTVGDAKAVANQLRDPVRCAYPANHVHLLTEENGCRTHILSALDWLADATGAGDTAVVYFSGHGMETPEYYLLPYGYDLTDLEGTAISGEIFTEHLRAIKADKLLVFLDCCHAGGQAEAKGMVKSPLPSTVIDNLASSSGRVILASSRKDEQSWTGYPYSAFTTALLEALAGHGAFELDGYARVLDLALWVGRKVPERTQDKQHPILKVSNLESNFAVAWYAGGDKSPQPLSWSSAPAPLAVLRSETAQTLSWRKMLANYRENLLLIEERMSEYIDFSDIPLQLVKSRRLTEAKILELETRLATGV